MLRADARKAARGTSMALEAQNAWSMSNEIGAHVFGSALIYAGMYKGTYGLPVFDAEGELHTAARLTYTLLETHGWLPSFLAG